MNIIEKAVEKLEAEVDDLLREEGERVAKSPPRQAESAPAAARVPAPPAGEPAAVRVDGAGLAAPAHPVGHDAAPARAESHSERVDLDLEMLGSAGYITPARDQTLLAEEFRIIKRPLLARATPGDPGHVPHGNLITITSSLPGEGKTFNSINLAFSIAMELNRTVLLVDADVAKSDVSRVLGIEPRKGLSSYLDGSEKDLSKLIVRTNVDSLTILPSGPRHPRITELVASDQMRALVAELATRYPDRMVIFDSPPLLATSGASVLAGLMGQVVMVVEAVRTPQSAVQESVRRLGRAPNVSIVFNKQRRMGSGRYGYDYGYGYGYAYGHDAVREPAARR